MFIITIFLCVPVSTEDFKFKIKPTVLSKFKIPGLMSSVHNNYNLYKHFQMSFYGLNENNVLNQIKFHIDLIKIVFSVKTNTSSSYKSELITFWHMISLWLFLESNVKCLQENVMLFTFTNLTKPKDCPHKPRFFFNFSQELINYH